MGQPCWDAASLVHPVEPFPATTPNGEVADAFQRDPGRTALPMRQADGRIALIGRVAFLARFAGSPPEGWERRPVAEAAVAIDRDPLTVEAATALGEVAVRVIADKPEALATGFVVNRGDAYAGIAFGVELFACLAGQHGPASGRRIEDRTLKSFENSPVAMYRALPDGRLLVVNEALARLYGHGESGELLARLERIHEVCIDTTVADDAARVLGRDGEVNGLEYQVRRQDGAILWVSENCRTVRAADGEVTLLEGTILDITERTKYEFQLAREQVLLRATLENMDQGIMITEPDGMLSAWNPRFAQLLGLPEDFLARHPALGEIGRRQLMAGDLVEYDDPPAEAVRRWGAARPGAAGTELEEWRRPNGRVLEVRTNHLPEGGFVRTVTDVTDRKRAEKALRASEQMLHAVIDAIPAKINVKDLDQRYRLMNRYQAEFYEVEAGAVVGRTPHEVLGRADGLEADLWDLAVIETGEALPFYDEEERDARGETRHWLTTKVPLKDRHAMVSQIVTVSLEISGRKHAEAALAQEKAFLRATLENMDQAVIMMDRDLRLIGWNLRCVDLLDLPKDLLDTRPTMDDIAAYHAAQGEYEGDADVEEQVHFWGNQRAILESWPIYERRRPNGTVIEVRTNRLPGHGYVCTYTDITERKEAEEMAIRHREQLRAILDASPVGVCITDGDGTVIWCNSRLAEILGATRDRIVGGNRFDWFVNTGDPERVEEEFRRTGSVRDVECEMRRLDGSRWWTLMTLDPKEFDGQPGTVSWLYDLTARRQAEQALRQSEERLNLAVSTTRSGVWDADYQTGVHWWSPEFLAMMGYDSDELPREAGTWEMLIHPEERARVTAEAALYLAGERPAYHATFRMSHKDGGDIWVEARGHALRDTAGKPLRFTGIMSDITERRRNEEALRAAQEGLIQAEKMASLGGLVAGVAHEINTPIGSALTASSHLSERTEGFSCLFESGTLRKSDAQGYIKLALETTTIITSNISRAAELIQSFKQVAVDQSSDERRRFKMRGYIDEVLTSLRPRLRKAAHSVAVDCPMEMEVDTYPGALFQVLTNLVMNALVHAFAEGQTGGIIITVGEPADGEVELRFADSGRGIPKNHLARIFDPFFTTRRGSGGTGLGLHIVFNIVTRRLGGTIKCDSTEGRGTTFTIRFPRVAPAEAVVRG
ncbi:MAG TPA: PAS domain S-box protein [Azospirillaceae bacterium]|nr:PAS domain S-box protein [Azospirillaceae bacterium]